MAIIPPTVAQEKANQFYANYQNLDLGNILSPSKEEMIRIALFIEERLKTRPCDAGISFERTTTGLARSIFYSPVREKIYICCKLQNKSTPRAGAYRFVKPKFFIAYDVNHPELVCFAQIRASRKIQKP